MTKTKSVSMKLSLDSYKEFKSGMKKLGFLNEDLFMKYCVLKTIKPNYSANVKKLIEKEIKEIASLKKMK